VNPPTQSLAATPPAPYAPEVNPVSGYALLAATARKILEEKDIIQVFRTICEESCRVLGADRSMIARVHAGDPIEREILYSYQLPSEYIEALEKYRGPSLLTVQAFQSGRLEVVSEPDLEDKVFSADTARKAGHKTICLIPLTVGKKSYGVLALYYLVPREYSLEDRHLAEDLGELASLAIEKSELVEALEVRIDGQESLQRALRQIISGRDVNEIVRNVLSESERVMGTNRCSVMLPEARTGELQLFVSKGISSDFVDQLSALPEPYPIGQDYVSNPEKEEPTVIVDATADLIFGAVHAAEGHRTLAAFPLRVEGGNIGALFYFWTSQQEIDDQKLSLGQAFADGVAVAIENARLYRESEKRAMHLELANEIARAVCSSLEPEELFKTIVQEIRRNVSCDRCTIGIPENGKWKTWRSESDVKIEPLGEKFGDEMSAWYQEVYEKNNIVNIGDIRNDLSTQARHLEKSGIRSVLIMPILKDGHCISHVSLNSKQFGAFTSEHEEFLTSISGHLGSAIENANLHNEAQESRDFFRSVVDDNADAIIVTDPSRKILTWNQQAEELYGYTEAEVLGKNVIDLLAPKGQKNKLSGAQGNFEEVLREGKVFLPDVERQRKDGTLVSVEITVSPVKNYAGEIIAACGFSKDLSERKRVEENLRIAKEAAEAANRVKSEFLANVSHELRSPLNSVIGFSELLMMKSEDEESLRLLPKIRDAGKYLSRLIDDLRDVERIEAGKLKLDFSEVPLNILIGKLIDTWKSNLPEGFTVEHEFSPDYRTILCDSVRISQVMNNLLDNAVKYSPKGGVIRVQTQAKESEVWISVHDEGIGISPENQETIFDRFRQLGGGSAHASGGLGIGLYLVRQLLTMHEGRIWAERKEKEGSVFTFALPYQSSGKNLADSEKKPKEGFANSKEEPWAGRKILLVDDIEMFHEYINMLMKSASNIFSAYNGMEGVTVARHEKPDLILMDLRMPVMNGFEAVEKLKNDPATKDIPVLAVTAQVMEEDKERCANLGVEGFVTKPINLEELVEQVERALSKNR
jgi:PAS domain S-box-containing protein